MNSRHFWAEMANTYLKYNAHQDALTAYTRALEAATHPVEQADLWCKIGDIHLLRKNLPDAVTAYHAASECDPQDHDFAAILDRIPQGGQYDQSTIASVKAMLGLPVAAPPAGQADSAASQAESAPEPHADLQPPAEPASPDPQPEPPQPELQASAELSLPEAPAPAAPEASLPEEPAGQPAAPAPEQAETAHAPVSHALVDLPIEDILPDPRPLRAVITVAGLTESVRAHGIIQPLIVAPDEATGKYVVIAGNRRLEAARQAGLVSVPAIVRPASPRQRLEWSLVENTQRTDLNVLERAAALRDLSMHFSLTEEEISLSLSRPAAEIKRLLNLLRLGSAARAALLEQAISEAQASALLSIDTPEMQNKTLDFVIAHRLDAQQTQDLVRCLICPQDAPVVEFVEAEVAAEAPVVEFVEAAAEAPVVEFVEAEVAAEAPVVESAEVEVVAEVPVVESVEAVAEVPVAESATVEVAAEAPVAESAVVEVAAEASVAESAVVEVVAEAPVAESVAVEAVAEAPVAESAVVEVAAEAPVAESAVVEVVAEAPVAESVAAAAEAPLAESATVEVVAEAPVAESAVVEVAAEASVAESAVVEVVAEAPVAESAAVEAVAEAPVAESVEAEVAAEAPVAVMSFPVSSPQPVMDVAAQTQVAVATEVLLAAPVAQAEQAWNAALDEMLIAPEPAPEPPIEVFPVHDDNGVFDEARFKAYQGISLYERVTADNPENDRAWHTLGKYHSEVGHFDKSIECIQRAISIDATKDIYFYHLGQAYAATRRYLEAIRAFEHTVALNPQHIFAHCSLAGYYRRLGNDAEAIKHIEVALPNIRQEKAYNQACFEAICGNTERAIELLKTSLRVDQVPLEWLRRDPDLDFIREDSRFQQLLSDQESLLALKAAL